jgi:hypothetical protein
MSLNPSAASRDEPPPILAQGGGSTTVEVSRGVQKKYFRLDLLSGINRESECWSMQMI